MNVAELDRFNLVFPGSWISGPDRRTASETSLMLRRIEYALIEAVAAFSLFEPITQDNVSDFLERQESRYERCLNGLYAKAFVYALDSIEKLLRVLCRDPDVPDRVTELHEEYRKHFGHLKHIRDSAIHIEDRGRGLDKKESRLKTNLLVLGSFLEKQFCFTGEDGNLYEIEISERTLSLAHQILQNVICAFKWEGWPNC